LVVDDPAVSRDHLEVRIGPRGEATLVDMSTNGTRVNGTRVLRAEPVPLRDGDSIELGQTRLTFRSLDASERQENMLRTTVGELEAGRLTLIEDDPLVALTERERVVLGMIAQGHSNAAIAKRLFVSVRTVEGHVRNVMVQLQLPETADANRRVHAVLTYLRATILADASQVVARMDSHPRRA
jgi:DNA-binding CsgD family transcriptional regulator